MFSKKLRVGFISFFDPKDRFGMSGTSYKIAESLEKMNTEIVYIPARYPFLFKKYRRLCKYADFFSRKKTMATHTKYGAKLISAVIDESKFEDCDVLFAVFCSEALFSIKNKHNKPLFYLSDCTFKVMVNYYFHKLPKWNVRHGSVVEKTAMDKSSALILSSSWAANSAVDDYNQSPSKVHVVEFGANIDNKDITLADWTLNSDSIDLLFLGVDWVRKGGAIALEACKWLNDNGIKATLHIVGIRELDDSIKKLPYVDFVGFLNKNNPEQYKMLVSLILKCQCLLLPTIAECSAISFCEASSYGLPVFSHITGGVANYVVDGVNGYLLPIGSTGADFGKKIKSCLDNGELLKMHTSSRELYLQKLNWDAWSTKVEEIIKEYL